MVWACRSTLLVFWRELHIELYTPEVGMYVLPYSCTYFPFVEYQAPGIVVSRGVCLFVCIQQDVAKMEALLFQMERRGYIEIGVKTAFHHEGGTQHILQF